MICLESNSDLSEITAKLNDTTLLLDSIKSMSNVCVLNQIQWATNVSLFLSRVFLRWGVLDGWILFQ